MALIDFNTLTLPTSPNYYLVAPQGYGHAGPDKISTTYEMSADQLQKQFSKMIMQQPRVTLIEVSKDGLQYQYRQRSLVFRFPDFVDVRYIPIDDHTSTLAIYSRAKYGYSDFGVNKKRVEMWLALLQSQ